MHPASTARKFIRNLAPPLAQAANDHVGTVKEFSAPASPQAPALSVDLASELAQYDAKGPGSTSSATTDTGYVAPGTTGSDEFLSFLEADIPKGEAHRWIASK
jgi:F-type H+-transporting ATPase subunit h